MKIVYGYELKSRQDTLLLNTERVLGLAAYAALPGHWLANIFPALRHLPEWLPGCAFQKFAREARELVDRMLDEGYSVAKRDDAVSSDAGVASER